ncbi:hypothetical protein BJ138DRAFT_509039 [Hygrophoropsis aurantiaca]|uniref:Uncharacterized protein n=1 Tax=Hygrophoropsis aurantiaca TaxID=72124 RepID=A0ACB8A2E6_9AGAM|nr:hypothetical protein BJ138DRAFT_509039 [Hygrophoropsis aurantiaca]
MKSGTFPYCRYRRFNVNVDESIVTCLPKRISVRKYYGLVLSGNDTQPSNAHPNSNPGSNANPYPATSGGSIYRTIMNPLGTLEGNTQAQTYQRAVRELKYHWLRLELELIAQVNYLADEIALEKRFGIAQRGEPFQVFDRARAKVHMYNPLH